ncbi:MAG TPA: flagellar hook-basal body complex protein [Stellaceae bacterium]|jgi:flagellar hook protein FlgE|nr:flagellar hook-basal body complex protein [Stellaceae bacterium]
MSILGALYSAVSGLAASSNALGMISDNISNSNTVGYKETSTNFSTLVTQASGATTLYSPGGVQSSPVYNIDNQGVMQSTASPTDLAISGHGFFVVNVNPGGAASGATFSFTRAGNFTVDSTGNLVNGAGLYLQGQKLTPAQSLAIANGNLQQLTATSLNSLQTVNVTGIGGSASATANVTISANLPASDTSTTGARTMTVPVFDSQGIEHDMTLSFTRTAVAASSQGFTEAGAIAAGDVFQVKVDGQTLNTAALGAAPTLTDVASAIQAVLPTGFTAAAAGSVVTITDSSGQPISGGSITATTGAETFTAGVEADNANEWNVSASFPNAGTTTATIAAGDNIVKFNTDGSLDLTNSTFATANALSVNWDPSISGGASPQPITFDIGTNGTTNGLSQLGTTFSVGTINQDGVKFGNFTGVTVDANGIVTANFNNGLHQAIYILPIATFADPDGLTPVTGNTYQASAKSGAVLLNQAGTGAAGTVSPSSLENSTVDIATEFSKLIIMQNAYQANSKVITVSDQMLQALLNIQTG